MPLVFTQEIMSILKCHDSSPYFTLSPFCDKQISTRNIDCVVLINSILRSLLAEFMTSSGSSVSLFVLRLHDSWILPSGDIRCTLDISRRHYLALQYEDSQPKKPLEIYTELIGWHTGFWRAYIHHGGVLEQAFDIGSMPVQLPALTQ